MNWTLSIRKLGKTLQSNFWSITSVQDGLVNVGDFHKNFIHIGTLGKILSVEDGLVTKSSRLLIPSTLKWKVMEQSHEGYQGMEKYMLLKAKESVFWPGISDDIWEAVEQCGICQSTCRAIKPGRKCHWSSTTCMTHPWNWSVLLEQDRLT